MKITFLLAAVFNLFCTPAALANGVRTLKLNQTTVGKVFLTTGRSTVLSFPTKPNKVILGSQGGFGIEYVENDLAIAPLGGHSHSNLFVYEEGRRFAFDLIVVPGNADSIVLVRDAEDPSEPQKLEHLKKAKK
jgi:hypothetical protein